MKWQRVLFLFGIILFLTGCSDFFMICSLNPYYLEKNITLVPEIEGSWTVMPMRSKSESDKDDKEEVWKQSDTTAVWKIERRIEKQTTKNSKGVDSTFYKPLDSYNVKLVCSLPDSAIYQFRMVLFRVEKVLYADFMPIENSGLEKSRFASESYFRIHTLARVVLRDKHPEFSWLGATNMKEMIEKKRVRVSYRWISDAGRLLLTGSSEQLTGMIERYAGEPRFIDWESQPAMLKLNRIK